ncbi:hypothetical protein OG874_39485 [Nocardia sp. NBC_00565]|uniref:WXG100-like domain-containing protein n=1 Tax=Nocardia sp. NBC_00565 TaxID=2975993 RepID=UPI002E81142D|nr:hypothetical protein [Nocardia sp. NBC_00565]WUC02721.1 hypothetical protein OG874_39485 [Nocardia sp. NBC_00565]
MSIEVPHEVALFLNYMGVPYPDIDEDQVRELAGQVRDFATNLRDTHESATGAIQDMGSVYSGYSYEQLVTVWARMSSSHMADLDGACHVVAKVLDVAAEVITVVKVAVLAGLAAMAASYTALMAATVPTVGLSAALTAAIRAAATKVVTAMEQMVIGYIATEVIDKAIEPLEHTIERMINGVVYDAAKQLLDVPPDSSSALPLHIEPDEVLRYSDMLDEYADDVLRHAMTFADNVAALDFSTSSERDDLVGPGPNTSDITPGSSHPDTGPELSSTPTTSAETAPEVSGSRPMEAAPVGANSADSRTADTSDDGRSATAPERAAVPKAQADTGTAAVPSAQERTDSGGVNSAAIAADRAAAMPTPADNRSLPTPTDATHNLREMTQRLPEISPHSLENVAQPIEDFARHSRSGEHSPASLGADTPENVLPPGSDSVQNSHANTTDGQPGASPVQGTRQGISSSTPWQRSVPPGKRAKAAAKPAASNVGKQRATDPATDKPIRTPWSTKPEPTPVTDPKVFTPDTAGPAPVLPADSLATAAERPNKAADRATEPPI